MCGFGNFAMDVGIEGEMSEANRLMIGDPAELFSVILEPTALTIGSSKDFCWESQPGMETKGRRVYCRRRSEMTSVDRLMGHNDSHASRR